MAWLSFDRPPDDQVRFDDLVDLRGELTALAPDEDISVVVLGSARPGGFIGHADRGEIKAMREGGSGRLEEWLTTLLAIEDLPQPVVAAVRGPPAAAAARSRSPAPSGSPGRRHPSASWRSTAEPCPAPVPPSACPG
ncbi:hypothetical protein [Actinomadura madurae]|uniref:hypothetical protein n=1 Tax=Actinomadura madurae TaxID=1993 RepID=UPI0020D244DB|nr:hypothetical protein [Actinomadura madurae]MCP9948161.1 hypothetical protein [Actinomadura madurae]MCQ0011076.1 hypothetical protein [Actinomadura madurae]